MKAITLWQPWASLLASGAKIYETRGWSTSYRGPIAIHAAKQRWGINPSLGFSKDGTATFASEFCEAFKSDIQNETPPENRLYQIYGAVIATAELVNCWRIVYHPGTNIGEAKHIPIGAELDVPRHHPDFAKYIVPTNKEQLFGDWTLGRYAWEFADMKILPEPIPAKGKQRLWEWNTELTP